MALNESIVEDTALIMPGSSLTRHLPSAISAALRFPAGEENRDAIRRLNPAIPEEARAVVSILENTAALCERSTP